MFMVAMMLALTHRSTSAARARAGQFEIAEHLGPIHRGALRHVRCCLALCVLCMVASGCDSERRSEQAGRHTEGDAAGPDDIGAPDSALDDADADMDADRGPDMAGIDGGDRRCDPLRDDGVLCECTLPGFQPLDPSWLSYTVYCCDERDERPWACAGHENGQEFVYWFDMSHFGSSCGGRDFPHEQAIDSCPWQE